MYRIWVALFFCVFFFLLLCISGSILYQYFGWKLADLTTIVTSTGTPAEKDPDAQDDPAPTPEIEMVDPKNGGNYLAVKDQEQELEQHQDPQEQSKTNGSPSPSYEVISQDAVIEKI
jgi:hypothetical protein